MMSEQMSSQHKRSVVRKIERLRHFDSWCFRQLIILCFTFWHFFLNISLLDILGFANARQNCGNKRNATAVNSVPLSVMAILRFFVVSDVIPGVIVEEVVMDAM